MLAGDNRDFPAAVLAGLKATPFARVAVSSGKDPEAAWEALRQCAIDEVMAPARLDLATLGSNTDFWFALSTSLGGSGCPGDLDEFLAETTGWYQPRMIVLTGAAEKGSMAAILGQARLLAEVTRDCMAPLRFVWLHDATQATTDPEIPYEVWPPQWRDIPQLDFTGNLDTVLYRAFRLYLDRRVYWEAAGQGERVRVLEERILARGLCHNSRSLDQALGQILDATPIPDEERRFVADCLADPAHQETLTTALRQKSFPPADPRAIQLWHAAGILWRPPGISRWHITPACVRILIQSPDHFLSRRLGVEVLKRRIVQARANAQVSQMALVLTTQVEAELLDALRWRTSWKTLLTQCGLTDDLAKYQARVGIGRESIVKTDGCLLDYASFGQLVRLAEVAGPAFKFPLSRERLSQIADVRNSAAHGHPVRWEGLRVAVEALVALGA
ncbi:MAG: hypothetical protein RKP73_05950 [Candidatus Contendobacter sp.]|nr:hypothetical protein [Candidatus Contendobacter sp.]